MVQDQRPSGAPFKRLFFALPVSDEQCRALAQWRRSLNLRSGKPVPAENFHVTLLFLGDVDAEQVPAICTAVDQLRRPVAPPRLLLDRLQVWPRASALVLEAQQAPAALLQLVYGLQQALLPLGVEAANREYRPHLTLCQGLSRPAAGGRHGAGILPCRAALHALRIAQGPLLALGAMAVERVSGDHNSGVYLTENITVRGSPWLLLPLSWLKPARWHIRPQLPGLRTGSIPVGGLAAEG
ncbi:RNA 2',3'-cyclic phosphodiesterase [Pseudomonas mosselii]|nr:RNA 2',3'-cyclic phosphodiesterase [Pseudomonas mosselii]UPF05998.1 RNA 2',3'-cyclic phosphodiesterase [Pseudomonas mosselii]